LNVLQGKESLNGMDSAGAWIWEPQSWSLGCTVHKFNALSYSAIYSTNCSTIDKICFLCFRLCMLLFYLSTWATIPPFYMQLLGHVTSDFVQLPLPRSGLGNTFDVVFCERVLHIPWFKVQTILLKLCCWKDSPNFKTFSPSYAIRELDVTALFGTIVNCQHGFKLQTMQTRPDDYVRNSSSKKSISLPIILPIVHEWGRQWIINESMDVLWPTSHKKNHPSIV
jgi:hypothetical protein